MKNIAVFGSTGSIGTQALSVAAFHRDEFTVKVIAANRNIDLVEKQAAEFSPEYIGIYDEAAAKELKGRLPKSKIVSGKEVDSLCALSDIHTVVNGVSGFAGLFPLLSALRAGKTVALANKESIVCAHEMVNAALQRHGGAILPVDSEQSALFQCLAAGRREDVKSLILTASGGMFRDFTAEQLQGVTPDMALHHPTWSMGKKITVDSATLMNKGLEVIEAKWLFDVRPEQIEVVVHPQSVVHSMVQFRDGSIKAQLGLPNMELPIQYALSFPKREADNARRLSFADYPTLTFAKPDFDTFTCLALAYKAIEKGGNMPCIMNAANEVAVVAFLQEKIAFLDIPDTIATMMEKSRFVPQPSLDDLLQTDTETRQLTIDYLNNK